MDIFGGRLTHFRTERSCSGTNSGIISMAKHHRLFVAFAIEDERTRDFLVGQARNERTPFEFIDMSVKQPWDDDWKRRCRSRIKGCDGVIALVSRNTAKASGQLWEILTAKEEHIPVLGIYTSQTDRPAYLPSALSGVAIRDWTWPNVQAFIDRL